MKVKKIENSIISFAKAMPMVAGAAAGLVKPAQILFRHQDAEGAGRELIANYTFYNSTSGTFDAQKGVGVKGLAAGTIVSKVVSWLAS